jgi:hypothetical protein
LKKSQIQEEKQKKRTSSEDSWQSQRGQLIRRADITNRKIREEIPEGA